MESAFGPLVITPEGGSIMDAVDFKVDFLAGPAASATDDAAPFDLVGTSAGLVLADDELNGVGTLTSNSTNQAFLVQNGEPFKLQTGVTVMGEARVNLTDADGMSFIFGIGITNANPFTTSWTDYVGLFTTDGNIKYGCGKDNNNVPGSGTSGETDADSGVDFADDTWTVLKFVAYGTNVVKFFVDGVFVGQVTSNLPDNENLAAHIGMVGSSETIDIDYVRVIATRDTAA